MYGCRQEVFCRLCKTFLFSLEEIEREEMKLNKNETKKAETKIKKTMRQVRKKVPTRR